MCLLFGHGGGCGAVGVRVEVAGKQPITLSVTRPNVGPALGCLGRQPVGGRSSVGQTHATVCAADKETLHSVLSRGREVTCRVLAETAVELVRDAVNSSNSGDWDSETRRLKID